MALPAVAPGSHRQELMQYQFVTKIVMYMIYKLRLAFGATTAGAEKTTEEVHRRRYRRGS